MKSKPHFLFIQKMNVKADMASYNILLKACCLAGRVDLAQDIYQEVQDLELSGALKLDVFTYSTIIKVNHFSEPSDSIPLACVRFLSFLTMCIVTFLSQKYLNI